MANSGSLNSKDCVLFATADWDTPYWTNKQHTAHHLALQGFRVLYIESIGIRAPNINSQDFRRIWHRLKLGLLSPKMVEPNVWVLSPLAIPFKQHWPLIRAFNQGWLRSRIKFFMVKRGFKVPMIWTYHPFMLAIINRIKHGPLVYHCVDDLSAVPGIDADAFNAEERMLLPKCKSVFVTSTALKEKCERFNANTHFYPNVVDKEHFNKALQPGSIPADLAVISEPRLCYHGVLSDFKIDFHLILDCVRRKPDWNWIFIGEEREGQKNSIVAELAKLPNVHFIGYRPFAVLPDYLRGMQVGLLPSLINDYTRGMFPMKYFEYLASGLPTVSTPLEFSVDYSCGMAIAKDAEHFIYAIQTQLNRGRFSMEESEAMVRDNTWQARLQKMLLQIQQVS